MANIRPNPERGGEGEREEGGSRTVQGAEHLFSVEPTCRAHRSPAVPAAGGQTDPRADTYAVFVDGRRVNGRLYYGRLHDKTGRFSSLSLGGLYTLSRFDLPISLTSR